MTTVKINFEPEDKNNAAKTGDLKEVTKMFAKSLFFLYRSFGVTGVSVKIVKDDGDE